MTQSSLIFGLIFAVSTIGILLGLIAGLSKTGKRWNLAAETGRKLVHVAIGLFALTLPLFLNRSSFAIFALIGFITLGLLRLPRVQQTLSRSVHAIERKSWGDILLLLSISVLFFLASGDPLLYILPLSVITLSDACAALVGTQYGQRKFGSTDREKSLEGTVIFFLITWVITVTILILTPSVNRDTILALATIIAAFASLVEASSWRGLDNLFVPIGIYALLAFNPQSQHEQLVLAGLFIAILILSAFSMRLFSISRHACRSLAICLFLTIGLSSFFHALFAMGSLIAYISLRRFSDDGARDDLEFVVMLTLIGTFWLLAGNIANLNAISLYMMNFAAILAGFISAHFTSWYRTKRLVTTIISGLVVLLSYGFLIHFETMLPLSGINITLLGALAIAATTILGFFTTQPLRHMPYKMAIPASLICAAGFFIMGETG